MGGEQVCLIRKPGITTTMKSMISYGETSTKFLDTVGWGLDENKQVILDSPSHTFSGKLPLKFLMGFAEDYNKGILNIKQELILIIARSFKNSYMGEVDANVTINKIEWKIRHVMPSDRQKLKLLNRLNKSSTAKIKLAYRMWDLYELPAIRETASDIWAIKTTSSLERPRYIIIGFQSSDNTDDRSKDATKFIHAGVNNIRLYLNSEVYPYERWNLDFDRKLDAVAYYAYENFQRSYYGKDMGEPMMSIEEFRKNPLFIIDCYHQPDAMKTSTVDIKLEFETRETKFPPNTKVRAVNGGVTRKLTASKTDKKADLSKAAVNLFFPNVTRSPACSSGNENISEILNFPPTSYDIRFDDNTTENSSSVISQNGQRFDLRTDHIDLASQSSQPNAWQCEAPPIENVEEPDVLPKVTIEQENDNSGSETDDDLNIAIQNSLKESLTPSLKSRNILAIF
ncbi:unnamed protein product [Phaedon cochleariae]|uniref:Double jelly roll-like domain-containing protein n=1 Tax=Phaedon cochleariae TaxID=80249 RepID=A0A9N9SJL0_PHACE|nr:unnamed protein product [Phaedon cochleariae]